MKVVKDSAAEKQPRRELTPEELEQNRQMFHNWRESLFSALDIYGTVYKKAIGFGDELMCAHANNAWATIASLCCVTAEGFAAETNQEALIAIDNYTSEAFIALFPDKVAKIEGYDKGDLLAMLTLVDRVTVVLMEVQRTAPEVLRSDIDFSLGQTTMLRLAVRELMNESMLSFIHKD